MAQKKSIFIQPQCHLLLLLNGTTKHINNIQHPASPILRAKGVQLIRQPFSAIMLSVKQSFAHKDVLGSKITNSAISQETQGENTVEKYISKVIYLYGELSKFPNLAPSPEVNAVFGSLVCLCTETPSKVTTKMILTDPRILKITTDLRRLCSQGEYQLEAYWAEKIGNSDSKTQVNANLLNFPYYRNYVDLTRMELHALFSMSHTTPQNFAFIGSGPLPLTSLCIADFLDKESKDSAAKVRIHNIDHNRQAISFSSSLCQKFGQRARSMTFQCSEAIDEEKKQKLNEFDVVYLAALVGSTNLEKRQIIKDVAGRMKPGALLILRSAHSLRSLLYPVIDIATDLQYLNLQPLLTVHPYNHIVNSIVILRVLDAPSGNL